MLGIADPHPLGQDLWDTVQSSCEAAFYSDADWQRLRWELWFANRVMSTGRQPSGHTWSAVQSGMNELLLSPAVKRRAGIEMKPDVDADKAAADEQIVRYKQRLKSIADRIPIIPPHRAGRESSAHGDLSGRFRARGGPCPPAAHRTRQSHRAAARPDRPSRAEGRYATSVFSVFSPLVSVCEL